MRIYFCWIWTLLGLVPYSPAVSHQQAELLWLTCSHQTCQNVDLFRASPPERCAHHFHQEKTTKSNFRSYFEPTLRFSRASGQFSLRGGISAGEPDFRALAEPGSSTE